MDLGGFHYACRTLTFLLEVTKREYLPWLEISQMAFPWALLSFLSERLKCMKHLVFLSYYFIDDL